jgi:lysophospholipase L1-like esterase
VDDLPGALKAAVGAVSSEIGFLDLTSPFLNEAADGPLLYLPDDTHWSAEGHRRAAAALADLLAERRDSGRSYRGRSPDPRLTTRE